MTSNDLGFNPDDPVHPLYRIRATHGHALAFTVASLEPHDTDEQPALVRFDSTVGYTAANSATMPLLAARALLVLGLVSDVVMLNLSNTRH